LATQPRLGIITADLRFQFEMKGANPAGQQYEVQ